MAHVRQQLRDAVVALLSGLPTTGARVTGNRALPLAKSASPSLTVRTLSERSTDISQDGTQERVIALRVDVTGKDATEALVSDMLDDSAAEVETRLANDPSIGGLAHSCEYRSAELSIDGSGEKILGTLALTFDVTLYTKRTAPQSAL